MLNSAERADVLAGTNAIDITPKLAALLATIAATRPGATVDASMVGGTWTWSANPFAALYSCRVTLLTGAVTIKMDFNQTLLLLPSHFRWVSLTDTRIQPTQYVTTLPVATRSPGYGLVGTKVAMTTGAGASGGTTLSVASAVGFHEGATVLIDGIELDPSIVHTLDGAISARATSFRFNESPVDTIGAGTIYLKIDREIIVGRVSDAVFHVLQRGSFGTVAASHPDGATAEHLHAFTSEIVKVAGDTVTIADALPRSFAGATVWAGMVDSALDGRFTIDGEFDRDTIAAVAYYGVALPLARRFRMGGGIRLRRAQHGAIILSASSDCSIEIEEIAGCGRPSDKLGGDVWVYGRTRRNLVRVGVGRDGYAGWYIDNKSAGHFQLDGPGEGNVIEIGSLTDGYMLEGQLSGCSGNTVRIGYADTSVGSVIIDRSVPQTNRGAPTSLNSISTATQARFRPPTGDAVSGNAVDMDGRSIRP